MGTYTSLYLNDYELVTSKSAVVPEVMTVFVEGDRRARWRRADDDALVDGPDGSDEDIQREVDYVVSVESAYRRLDVMGFTLPRCKREYEEIREAELRGLREAKAEEEEPASTSGTPNESWLDKEIRKYEILNFEDYAVAFKSILEKGRRRYGEYGDSTIIDLSPVERYIVEGEHDEWPHSGFFCKDVRSFIRLVLSVAPADAQLRQDISELVSSGWVHEDQRLRDDAVRELLERYPENAPRIVLTEGSSDALILEKSLQVLHPELVGYYTFFDFHGTRAPGGASQLVGVVKAFAAAGVANRVVAILDNDTAGHEAKRALRGVSLPSNIAVVHYPDRDWLRMYPTLGPSGEVDLDINGRAGNLEMYLGRDVLTTNGTLELVQWAGYSQTMRAYQGELVNKGEVADRWQIKADLCRGDPAQVVPADWEDLRTIWHHIFTAFEEA